MSDNVYYKELVYEIIHYLIKYKLFYIITGLPHKTYFVENFGIKQLDDSIRKQTLHNYIIFYYVIYDSYILLYMSRNCNLFYKLAHLFIKVFVFVVNISGMLASEK